MSCTTRQRGDRDTGDVIIGRGGLTTGDQAAFAAQTQYQFQPSGENAITVMAAADLRRRGRLMETERLLLALKRHLRDGDAEMPLHRRLKTAFERAIASHELKRGAVLPGERMLSETLGVSRVTLRKSIEALTGDGLLRRRHGARTEVVSPVEKSLSALTSFSEDMLSRGLTPGCIWIAKQLTRPSPAEMMALGVSAKTGVVRLKRIRTGDGTPIAVETAAVPARFLPSPDLVEDSLYAALEMRDIVPLRAIQRLRSRPASRADSELLQCDPGMPLLIADRRCFLADGQIVEFTETRYRGDVYDFVTELIR